MKPPLACGPRRGDQAFTAGRITFGELLKRRNGLRIAESYGSSLPGSNRFTLTMPLMEGHEIAVVDKTDLG